MGGGKSSADQTNQTINTNTVADNGAVALGQGASFSSVDQNVGLGGKLTQGNDLSGAQGVFLGEGASYTYTGLDDNSFNLLDQAQTLQYRNSENILSLMAAQSGAEKETIQRADLSKADQGSSTADGLKVVVAVVILALIGFFMFGRRKKK